MTHDAAGRLASNGPTTYRWDDFDALVAVEADSGVQEALQYDGLGRLVARHNRNRLEEELAWDGAQLVAAYDSSGAATGEPGLSACGATAAAAASACPAARR